MLFNLVLSAYTLSTFVNYLQIAVVFILMICTLVAAHEWGHYLAARSVGIEVEEFAIGFGKKLKTLFYRQETEFTLRMWPLGGFVRIKGMEPQEDGGETQIENGFYSKPPLARLWVLFAGPLFSVLFGALVLFGVFLASGVDKISNKPILGLVATGLPADKAGLKPGDRILRVDEQPVQTFFDVIQYVRERPEQTLQLTYERKGKQYTTTLHTLRDKEPSPVMALDRESGGQYLELTQEKRIQGKMGALPEIVKAPASVTTSFKQALVAPLLLGAKVWDLITHPAQAKESAGSLGSIAVATAEATKRGMTKVFELSALLSIVIAYMNLLPIPPLDGGQMVVAFVELLRGGRRLSFKVQGAISTIGFVLLTTLILSVVWLDIKRFATGDWSHIKSKAQIQDQTR
jgi:regulator of sigma E protease